MPVAAVVVAVLGLDRSGITPLPLGLVRTALTTN